LAELLNYLSVNGLAKSFGERTIFKNITFGLAQGERVALIAKNGTGKTSLFKIIAGADTPDTGNVVFRNDITFGYLSQNPEYDPKLTIIDAALHGDTPALNAVRHYEHMLHYHETTEELQAAIDAVELHHAWSIEARVKETLTRLKLDDHYAPVNTLSGGQIKRLALAELIISAPDILLLDEPTNHLDIDMIEWLQDYLSSFTGALFMVTHDRYFLEAVCNVIIEMEDNQLYRYEGNYSYYLEKKQERQEQTAANRQRMSNTYRRELEWVRQTPSARTGKSKSRLTSFEDIKSFVNNRKRETELRLEIKTERLGGKILELHKIKKAYPGKPIANGFSYVFKAGDRIGLVGQNGVGKSTFLKMIQGLEPIDGGKIVMGETVKIGYYNQDGMVMKGDKRVIDVVKDIGEYITLAKGQKITAGQLCERFMFSKEDQYTYVSKLSGGEKRRLYLLTVLIANPNVLILDEPTNDLDILTLATLEDFLEDYPGCLIIVSHDRYFLDKLTNHLFVFEGGGEIKDYNGSYLQYRLEGDLKETTEKQEALIPKKYRSAGGKNEKQKTKLSFKEKSEFDELTKLLPKLEARKAEITAFFESGSSDAQKLLDLSAEMESLQAALEEKELRWLELSELAEE
jgi:ATP-binding cassette subfamily F protein uup